MAVQQFETLAEEQQSEEGEVSQHELSNLKQPERVSERVRWRERPERRADLPRRPWPRLGRGPGAKPRRRALRRALRHHQPSVRLLVCCTPLSL